LPFKAARNIELIQNLFSILKTKKARHEKKLQIRENSGCDISVKITSETKQKFGFPSGRTLYFVSQLISKLVKRLRLKG
jgi:hypothetical protein